MLRRPFLSLLVVAIATKLHAADGSFVDTWKLNPEKSTMHDQMKVTSAGANRYAFDFGGGPEFIVANGTDQPGLDGTTLAVTAEAPRVWRVVRKKNGRMQIFAIWTLSPDGNSLRDDSTGYPPNGSSFTIHYIYTPSEGASGFAATWDSTSEKPDPVEIEVQPYQDNGLSFINQASRRVGASQTSSFSNANEHKGIGIPVGGGAKIGRVCSLTSARLVQPTKCLANLT